MNFKLSDFSRAGNGTLVAEASTIGFVFSQNINIDGRIFRFQKTDTDREDEITGWRYREITGTAAGENVLIIND
jgi:hypothetical protein